MIWPSDSSGLSPMNRQSNRLQTTQPWPSASGTFLAQSVSPLTLKHCHVNTITKSPSKAALHSCGSRLAPSQHDQAAAAFKFAPPKACKLGLWRSFLLHWTTLGHLGSFFKNFKVQLSSCLAFFEVGKVQNIT